MDKLSNGWKIAKIKSVVQKTETYNPQNSKDSIFNYIDIGSIDNSSFKLTQPKEILGKDAPSRARKRVRKGDVIFATTRPNLKNIAQIEIDYYNSVASTGFCILRPITEIDSKFLFYFLLTENIQNQIAPFIRGAQYPAISDNDLYSCSIPLPPLSEQINLVTKLDALFVRIDKSIALLEENIKHTKELMASVLEEVFENGKNWKREPLNKVAKVERGKSKHRPRNDQKLFGDSYPFIQTGDVRSANKYIDKYEVCYSEFGLKQSRLWNKGTICLTIAANIGDVAILGFDACFPDSVVGITPNSMNNEFLYYYLKTLQLQLDKKANSAAQKNINLKILSEIDVPVPSIEIQNSIADRFSRLEEKQFQILSVQQSKLNYLKALKSSLLDRAFKGEL